MKIVLYAKSSDGINFYEVSFENREGIINIKCNCRAGELTRLCRHKLSLIRGDSSVLYDDNQISEFSTVREWIMGSSYAELIIKYDSIEKVLKEKQKELKKIKEFIELAMRKGIQ